MFYTFSKAGFPAARSCIVHAMTYADAKRKAAEKLGGTFLLFCTRVEG